MNETFNVPVLPERKIQSVLQDAGLSLSPMRMRAFANRINTALANYAVAQILEAIDAVTPYKRIRRLKQIEAAAKRAGGDTKLQRLVAGAGSAVAAAASMDLRRIAMCRGFGAEDLLTDRARLAELARLAWQRLQVRLDHATRNRTKAGRGREGRHEGDKALRHFFGTINWLWLKYFRRVPGVTGRTRPSKKREELGAKTKPPRGQYVVLVDKALRAYAWEISNELERQVPGLRKKLRLERHAIHGYFRRTRISKLRRLYSEGWRTLPGDRGA